MFDNSKFQSQSETILETLVKEKGMSIQEASTLWFNSRTYNEIVKRQLTYISAMRGLFELNKELNNDPTWMKPPFDM